ncbi:MAG: orotate phosphoribosyltransferase [Gaiellaceae bacterium]
MDLAAQLREHALLEGDFVLRSGRRSSYYLDKYRFETRPELLGPIGERLAAAVGDCEPDAVRLAGPALGAVALAASASLAGGLPFVIVRDTAKSYGTGNRIEGPFEAGDLVCLIEDVVTSGGALAGAVEALRAEELVVRNAVCVVDREEGGSDALARIGVRLRSLFLAGDLLSTANSAGNPPRKPHG